MNNEENKKVEPTLAFGKDLTDVLTAAKLKRGSDATDVGKFANAFEPLGTRSMDEATGISKMSNSVQRLVHAAIAANHTESIEESKREIDKLKKLNEVLYADFANLNEEKQKLMNDLSTYKDQVTIYQAKDEQIETFITRLKESGKLSEDELKELNASEDEIIRLERARDLAIEDEKDTITEAIFQITDSMKSLKASMVLYVSLLIGSSVIAILLICSLLWSVFFGASVDVSKIDGLMANYLALASPSVLKIVLLVIVLRFINNILKLRENLLVETGYIEKVSGVLKAGMLMSDYSRSMIEARDIFKKVINQLIKKDSSLDKDKVKDDDDTMVTSIVEKTVSMMTKSIK